MERGGEVARGMGDERRGAGAGGERKTLSPISSSPGRPPLPSSLPLTVGASSHTVATREEALQKSPLSSEA